VEATAIPSARPLRPLPVAPAWHTATLVGLVIALAVGGALFQRGALAHPAATAKHPPVVLVYLWLLCLEWGLFLFVWAVGLRRTGTTLAEVVGGRWRGAADVARGEPGVAGAWVVFTAIALAWLRFVPSDRAASVTAFLPHGPIEATLAILVAVSAGICEEIVFRGYLQRQLEAWTGNFGVALVLQSLVFGVGHGYQGAKACGLITLFAVQFGLLARWRRSLRPGIIGHALTDLLAGLFGI
jgi:uncharacterized protein